MKFNADVFTSNFSFKEITNKQYKELLKVTWPQSPSPKSVLPVLFEIFSELTSKPPSFFYELSVFEVFLFLLELRNMTFGPVCDLSVSIDENNKKANLSLNLRLVQQTIKEFLKNNFKENIKLDNVNLTFQIPSIQRLNEPTKEECFLFLKEAEASNKNITIDTNAEAETLFYNLPPKFTKEIVKCYENFVEAIDKIDFLSTYSGIQNQHLPFYLTLDCLVWYTKLLFSEPLDTFYDNVFYLAHLAHIDPSYLETCTPGEYIYFVKKLEQTLAAKQAAQSSSENVSYEDDFVE
jgi:hypothetical protein